MDFKNVKEVIFNGKKHNRVYFGDKLVWQRFKGGDFSFDVRNLTEYDDFEGIWDRQKGALVVYGGTGANKKLGDYFTERVSYNDLDYLLELDLNTFKTGRWISKTYAKLDNVYLQSSYLQGRLDFYYKKEDGFYILRRKTIDDLKEMIGGNA